MTKRVLALLMVATLVFTGLVGCGGAKEEASAEKVLRWNCGSEPKTIDPQQNSANDGGHIINNTFEGLMREVNGKLEKAMAESYEVSEDGKTYTFKIRDAKWSDGQPVTAQDFEYGWKRALDPNLIPQPSEYAFQLFYLKGAQEAYEGKGSLDDVAVKAIDDKTLQVELLAPTPYFLELTAFYTLMPVRKDMVEKDPTKWATNPETAVSNGPFVVSEYHLGDKIVLKKNENYWKANEVKLDKIEALMIVDYATNLAAYESGDIDANEGAIPSQEIPRLLSEKDSGFEIRPTIGTYYYIFNVNKAPFDDVRVRRALSLAINRKEITENVTKGGQLPATGFVPPGLTDAEGNDFRQVSGNYGINPEAAQIEEAKKLLAEAGYPEGKGFPVAEVLYNTSDGHKAIAEAVQEMWRQNLGINVELRNQEWAVFQDTRHAGNFSMARAGWLGDYADPMTMLDLWLSYSGNNDAHWKIKEYDDLIEGSKLQTGQERFESLYTAEKMLMEQMPVLPVYYYTKALLVKPYVKNWEMTKLSTFWFGTADIEKAE